MFRYDSLIVGCPLCSLEKGVVYFYDNINGTLTSDPIRIRSPSGKAGRFGLSVVNIGDHDRDGIEGKFDYLITTDVSNLLLLL